MDQTSSSSENRIKPPAMPSQVVAMNSKAANAIYKIPVTGQRQPIKNVCGNRSSARLFVTLTGGTESINAFDMLILNICASFIKAGICETSIRRIYLACYGNGKGSQLKPRAAAINSIKASITKLSNVNILIDAAEQVEQWNKQKAHAKQRQSRTTYKGPLLPAAFTTKAGPGGAVESIIFKGQSPLYAYSSDYNQIIAIPLSQMDLTGSRIQNTKKNSVLILYLTKRIEQMRRSKRQVPRILYEKIFMDGLMNKSGKDPTRKERRTLQDDTIKILDYWTQTGYIKGFEPIKKNRQNVGVGLRL
jgi:hypothetical protein